jgi:hypothetical protein
MLNELLSDISPRFRPQDYSLLTHNCNHFSNELVQLLTGESVPVGACGASACITVAYGTSACGALACGAFISMLGLQRSQ